MIGFFHRIPENSSFFQGHPGQFFTKNTLSFRVKRIYDTDDEEDTINIPKYRHMLANSIIERIATRNQKGGNIDQISENDLQVLPVKLIDSSNEDNFSGLFEIYPRTALCTERGCHRFFELKSGEGKRCGHSTSNWEQITFIAFCDDCGRIIDFKYASNLESDCKQCGRKKSMTRLFWKKKDDLASFRVKCENCPKEESLFFYDCNHIDYTSQKKLFTGPKRHFRGVPTRANTVIHPAVLSTPDISEHGERDPKSGKITLHTRNLSASFLEFFPNVEESKLRLPEIREALKKDLIFQKLPKVIDIYDTLGFTDNEVRNISEQGFNALLQMLLKGAKDAYDQQVLIETADVDKEKIVKKFGIDRIKEQIEKLKDFGFGEDDLQALNLLDLSGSHTMNSEGEYGKSPFIPRKRTQPKSLPIQEYLELLHEYGLDKIIHISNLTMVQSLLGIIEGSTRNDPQLFNVLYTGNKKNRKPVAYVRSFYTEGIVFKMDYKIVLNWLYQNHQDDKNFEVLFAHGNKDTNFEIIYREIISGSELYKEEVYKLLHTFSHMLIQQSTIHTGLDVQSLAERIYPKFGMIFIYSTSGINIGGLESTFDLHIDGWMRNMADLALDCPQDPSCMIDENGSCNACCFVPEFVCENFNNRLDRSSLVGNSDRFRHGYLKTR